MLTLFKNNDSTSSFNHQLAALLNQEAIVSRDILPNEAGQILAVGGVHWRARSSTSKTIRTNKKVRIVERRATTLWVMPL